ncbi:MAG: protein kinase [Planctomycetia bacterium]|nr:protein kinase [Planctomycetia bacterium]
MHPSDRDGEAVFGVGGPAGPAEASGLSGGDEHFGLQWNRADGDVAGDEFPPGLNLGGVIIVRLLAEGGMGRVYEARQESPARSVAVKVIRGGLASASLVRRFEYEAQVLARLRHPHIAQIHTFGVHADARGAVPFFVMELVEGACTITEHVRKHSVSIRDRVALFRRICSAVAHGHRTGVIHRDLKPGNMLVDEAGEPKVIDFGVARSIDAERNEATAMTRVGDVVGTLRYMSPEQCGVEEGDVDARTDVYALGVVLYELVCGTLPYDVSGKSFVEVARILGDPASVPTDAVEAAARAGRVGGVDARALATLTGKCLEKQPADRYSTAIELEAELERWLAGEPVLARPPSSWETVTRFARRHRVATLAAAVVLVSLIAAVAGISFFYLRSERQRELADQARRTAELRESEAERQAAAARSQLFFSNVLLAAEARDRDNVGEARRLLDAARALVGDAGAAQQVEIDCAAASLDESLHVIDGHEEMVTSVAWPPDGSRVATGEAGGRICVQPPAGSTAAADLLVLEGHTGPVWSLNFSPDGALIASGAADGEVRIWDAVNGTLVRQLGAHQGGVYAASFSHDGRSLVTGARDRTARIWDVATWQVCGRLEGHQGTIYSACFSPDDTEVATASLDRTARIWDVARATARCTLAGHEGRVFSVAFAADGRTIATASDDGSARLWDAATGGERLEFRHPFRVNAVSFVGDGDRLATASGDGVLRVWSTSGGDEVARLRGHSAPLWSVACAPGSGTVATGSADGTARVWDVDFGISSRMTCGDKVLAVSCSPDGRLVATGLAGSTIRLWDAATLLPRGILDGAVGRVSAVRFTPDGRSLAGGCDDGGVRIWGVGSLEQEAAIKPHEKRIYSVDFSPDGRLVATAAEDRTARLWDLEESRPYAPPLKHSRRTFCAAFSPDGTLVATACEDRIARIWRVADGSERVRFSGHEGPVNWVAFSADGRLVATASSDGTVRIWNAADGTLTRVLTGPTHQVWKVAFSPDDRRIAAVSADGTARIWDVATGQATPALRGHGDQVWGFAFAPDGRSLFTGSWDGTARVWGVAVAEIARRRAVER